MKKQIDCQKAEVWMFAADINKEKEFRGCLFGKSRTFTENGSEICRSKKCKTNCKRVPWNKELIFVCSPLNSYRKVNIREDAKKRQRA